MTLSSCGGDSSDSSDAGVDGSGVSDASTSTDAGDVPVSDDQFVGTPPRPPTGAGDPPVVFWPKPAFAHPEVPFEFTMVAYDPEHEQLLYSLDGAPDSMTINSVGRIEWTPEASGTFPFEVLVDDGRQDPVRVRVSLTVDASKFLFVAVGGSGDGTLANPLGDIEQAMRMLGSRGEGTLYIRGGIHLAEWEWERNGVSSPLKNVNASPEAPVVVRGYPGEEAIIDCEEKGHGLWSFFASYILFADVEIRRPASADRGGLLLDGENCVAQNITVRDANWPRTQNTTGFLLRGDMSVCHRCRAYDNFDRDNPTHHNSSNYLTYADRNEHKLFILDSYSEGSNVAYKVKHAGRGNVLFHGNVDVGSRIGYGGHDDGTIIEFNTFIGNRTGLSFAISDPNAFTRGNMSAHHNTIVDAQSRGALVQGSYGQDGNVNLVDNIFVMSRPLGALESDPNMAFTWPYTQPGDMPTFVFDRNCYFAPNDDLGFRYGNEQAGSFASWQGRGFDASSIWGDPLFTENNYRVAPESGCAQLPDVGAW